MKENEYLYQINDLLNDNMRFQKLKCKMKCQMSILKKSLKFQYYIEKCVLLE